VAVEPEFGLSQSDLIGCSTGLATLVAGDDRGLATLEGLDPRVVLDVAVDHGLVPLVAEQVRARRPSSTALGEMFRDAAIRAAAADLVAVDELRRVLEALAHQDVPAIVMKGAHLAHDVYPRSDLRPRVDSDIFVREASRAQADDVLERLGYVRSIQVSGEFVGHQQQYVKRFDTAPVHCVDLHWRLANPQVFADAVSFDEMWSRVVDLPRLARAARAPSRAHSLLIACVHRVAHHNDSPRLIWLYDIDRLARRTASAEWEAFVVLARARDVATVCRRSLTRAALSHFLFAGCGRHRAAFTGQRDPPSQPVFLRHRRPHRGRAAPLLSCRNHPSGRHGGE
jgi:hypothetical protein